MNDVYILDGLRTAIGGVGKSLKTISAVDLAGVVIKALLKKHPIEKSAIDEVILGNAVGAGLGQNPARQALVSGGLPPEIPAFTVSKVCGSGLKALVLGTQSILCGDADIVIAGGTESISQCPYLLPRNIKLEDVEDTDIKESLINDGLWCNLYGDHVGAIAEYTAGKFNISREEQDLYAVQSHGRAIGSQENGIFKNEIVPVRISADKIFDIDEKPRKNISLERISKLPPAFKKKGTVTAGNSPAPADGAAAVILMSEDAVKKFRFAPIARILGYATVAVKPELVFTASSLAIGKCLKTSSLNKSDIDLFEVNESFAVQIIAAIKDAELDVDRLNVFGGAIALGHPLGASGARGVVTLINALKDRNEKTGVTSICLGGGCAVSMALRMM